LLANRKNILHFIRDKRLKKEEHCSQHSGDIGVQAWQDKKRGTMIFTYHKEVYSKVNKANKKETKPAVVNEYDLSMGAVYL
jgi:hypothetical protein